MQFAHPMVERTFQNNYDIIVFGLSLLLRQSQKQHNIFAGHCVWWLASIIQYTEIFKYYLEYQIFQSDYNRDCIVTTLPSLVNEMVVVPEFDIPPLDLDQGSSVEELPSLDEGTIVSRNVKRKQLNTTRSGRVFKNKPKYQEPTILDLEQCFGKQSKKQRRGTRDRLRAEINNMPKSH